MPLPSSSTPPVWRVQARQLQPPSTTEQTSHSCAMEKQSSSNSHESSAVSTGGSRASSGDFDKPITARPKRKRIAPDQLEVLLALFDETDTPSYEIRDKVGSQLGMSNREVQVWFQNRRAKERSIKAKAQLQEAIPLETSHQSTVNKSISRENELFTVPPPSAFNLGRRRSLSTGALNFPAPSVTLHGSPQHTKQRLPSAEPVPGRIGPIRPHMARYHTHQATGLYSRELSPPRRSAAQVRYQPTWTSRAPSSHPWKKTSPRLSETSRVHSEHRFETISPVSASVPCLERSRDPSPTGSHASLQERASDAYVVSNADLETIADRRQSRLPPIKLLLDIADRASAARTPGLTQSPLSAPSCSSISTPLSRLQILSPTAQPLKTSPEVSSYFEAKAPETVLGVHIGMPHQIRQADPRRR